MKLLSQLRENNTDFRGNLWYAVLVITTALMAYVIFLHPTASTDASSDLDTPTFYRIPVGSAEYVALAVSTGRGDVVDLQQGPFVSSSTAGEDLDRSADTAWVAVLSHWGCTVPYTPYQGVTSSGRQIPMASIEGKELPVYLGIEGFSGGVVYSLAQATMASGFAPDWPVAATGIVDVNGNVLPIGGTGYKMIAAAASGAKTVFVPRLNADEARRHAPDGLTVVSIGHISEALGYLGFPSSVDCVEAVNR